jgi:hypothetical protein
MSAPIDVMELVSRLKAREEPFILATVVRTVAATAAKAGAKAVIRADGTIAAGWIGGGCAKGAVLKAAREALADGQSRLVSVQPENLLAELGVKPGDSREGVRFAKNTCPSRGTMDIFVEPVLPRPVLAILGASPVAVALAQLAGQFGFHVTVAAPAADRSDMPLADELIDALFRRRLDPGQGRRGRAARRARDSGRLSRLRRQPPQDGRAAREAAGRRRRRRRARSRQGAGRARSGRDHARGDRPLHPRRDHRGAPARPARRDADIEPGREFLACLPPASTKAVAGPSAEISARD